VAICGNDLLHVSRDRTALMFMVVMPVAVMLIIGTTVFGAPAAVPVGLADEDGSPAAAQVRQAIEGNGALVVRVYDTAEDLRGQVRTGAVAGGVVIPPGFGAALDHGDHATVALVVDETQPDGPGLATVVRAAVAREGAVLAAARFAVDQGGAGADPAAAAVQARSLAAQVPPVPVQVAGVGEAPAAGGVNRFTYTGVSNLVLFVFISSLAGGAALIERRRLGVTRRMLAAPVTTGTVITGMAVSRLTIAVLQSAVILLVGAVVFRVRWGDPLGVALVVVSFAAVATGAALLVGARARNAQQAQAVGIPIAFGLGMLGGCLWPIDVAPAPLQAVGHLTPHAWAMNAWTQLVYDGAGAADIARDVALLAAVAAVLAVLAARALRRSLLDPP
jgi:ABC-2 type transport system permease protein